VSGPKPLRIFSVAIRLWLIGFVVLGLGYPLLVTGAARLALPANSGGSLITREDGVVIGSRLVGQSFSSDRYFHGRPSAAGEGYDALASGGSNLGPTSAELAQTLAARAEEALQREPGLEHGSIPADMITASGSGLDPHISPATALAQVARVAHARGLAEDEVNRLVVSLVRGRDLGLIGEPRVNVLELNVALDEIERP